MVIVKIPFRKPVFEGGLGRRDRDGPEKTFVTASIEKSSVM